MSAVIAALPGNTITSCSNNSSSRNIRLRQRRSFGGSQFRVSGAPAAKTPVTASDAQANNSAVAAADDTGNQSLIGHSGHDGDFRRVSAFSL